MRVFVFRQWYFGFIPAAFGVPWVLHLGPFVFEGTK